MPQDDFHKLSRKEQLNELSQLLGLEEDEQDLWQDEEKTGFAQQLSELTIAQYTSVPVASETEEKIQRLKKITASIENNILQAGEKHTLGEQFKIEYHKYLNPAQFLVATTTEGPLLVIAGAGSGKTHTLVYRMSYLMEKGVSPEEILLLTFTRKAANEMIRRANRLMQNRQADKVMGGTFHAFSNHILRRYANLIGLPSNFTIIDTSDAEDVVDLIRQELKFGKRSKAFPRKSRVHKIISKSRNLCVPIEQVITDEFSGLMEFMEDIKTISIAFHKYKRANKLLDYDDLMEILRNALRDNHLFRRKMQNTYRYVMVDEFQDTNLVQKEIVDYIVGKRGNVMVVGDDSQSIYAFRGANFENILRFPETYPDCKVVKLEQNYRSHQRILDFTNDIASQAQLGYQKQLFSERDSLWLPKVAQFYSLEEEAEFIVTKILELREKGLEMNEIAVLYRSTFHGNYVQTELLKRGIPYVVVGGIRFIERKHVKDLTAYLRILLNPFDAVSWNRVLGLLPGIGRVTASKIVREIQANNGLIDFSKFEKRKYAPDLFRLQDCLQKASQANTTIPRKISILTKYYGPILRSREDDFEVRMQDLELMYQIATKYEDLEKFLSDFALDPPSTQFQDRNDPLIDESEDKPVTLSTIHSAKGLEWYCVFVPHLLDGLFPSTRSLQHIEKVEEERRLFYVACSRAKEQLYLTLPSYFSNWDSVFTMPSRFLVELDSHKFEVLEEEG